MARNGIKKSNHMMQMMSNTEKRGEDRYKLNNEKE
jgi:hypothetical protein